MQSIMKTCIRCKTVFVHYNSIFRTKKNHYNERINLLYYFCKKKENLK